MSSTGKKRRDSPSSSNADYKVVEDLEGSPPVVKRPYSAAQDPDQRHAVGAGANSMAAPSDRTPIKVNLKRMGKREHGGVETPLKCSTDDEVAGVDGESNVPRESAMPWAGAAAPPPKKIAALVASFPQASPSSTPTPPQVDHSPSPARPKQAAMATNLRASLRGSNGGVGQKQVKKLVIKSTLEAPKAPEDFFQHTWQKLQEAVQSIHELKPVNYSLEELYGGVEGLCTHNYSLQVYDNLEAQLRTHLMSVLAELQESTSSRDDLGFLNAFNAVWKAHCEQMQLIRSIFLTLDRQIAAEASATKPIWEMSMSLFRTLIAEVDIIARRTKRGLLTAIESDRNDEVVDRSLIKSLCRMFISLGIYHDVFEPLFLQATEAYYANESSRLTQEMPLAQYLIHIERRFAFEEHTIGLYLASSSVPKLLKTLYDICISRQLASFIISKGLDELLDQDKHEDLKRVFAIVSLVDSQKPLRMAWNQYIKRRGSELVNDRSKDKTMIEELLTFRARLDSILTTCFAHNPDFLYSLKEGFEGAVNSRINTPSEMLAKFVDRHLQAGNRAATSDVEFEALFEKVMSIFRSLNSKDVFEAFYRKDLAKRLLLNKSASIDLEKVVLGHLKDECGAQYISKMEGMFKDIDLSKDLTVKFGESLQETPDALINPKVDIAIHVLTSVYWPTFTPSELNLPSELAAIHQAFSNFYLKQFHARNLVWLNSHGHVTLRAAFPKGRRELSVSTFQASILLLFNDTNQISYEDMANATGIKDKDELKRTVLSLFAGQFKVIAKLGDKPSSASAAAAASSTPPASPGGAGADDAQIDTKKDIAENDVFVFNNDFTSKKVRIKINQIQLKETRVEQQRTQETVFQDRIGQVDAALVRIMKTRKTLHHNELIAEVINILKFPFQASDLKKRIETLIDREFLARDKHDATLYNYLP